MNETTDWYDVEPFGQRDHRILEAERTLPCRMYLLTGEDTSLLIDAGVGVGDLRGLTDELVDTDVELLLTHTHWDHIGAAHQFDRVYAHPSERTDDGRVGLDTLTDEFVQRPPQFVSEYRDAGGTFPDAFDADAYTIPTATGVEPIEGGDTIDLGSRTIEIIDTPGHSLGHVAALDREAGVLHASDVVHIEKNLYVHFQNCDIETYVDTFETVIELREEGAFDTLTTAHNEPMSGDELSILDTLHEGLQAIIAGERTPEVVETKWGEANKYVIGQSEILTKPHVGQ